MKKLFLIATFLIPFYTFSQFENIERDAPWHLDKIHGKTKNNISFTITAQDSMQFNLLSDSVLTSRFRNKKKEGKYWVKDSTLYISSLSKKTGKLKVDQIKILDFSDNRISLKFPTKKSTGIFVLKNKIEEEEEEEETLPEDMYLLKSEGMSISGVALKN